LEPKSGGGWTLLSKKSTLVPVTAETNAAADILEIARPYHELAERHLDEPVATSPRDLESALGRVEDTAIIDAVQRVELYYSKADVSFASLFNPAVRVPKGPVTVRQIAALYPYDNELYVIEGTGKMVKVALENAAHFFSESGMPGFNYDMAKVWSMKSTAHSTKATAHATCVGTASRSRRSKSCASRCSQKCRRSDPARQAGRAFRWSLR